VVAQLVLSFALAPWSHPLAFAAAPGWESGRSSTTRSAYAGTRRVPVPLESAAWTASGVRYRDHATADPPNVTLRALPRRAVIVWAVIYEPAAAHPARIRLTLTAARRLACCEAVPVAGGLWELTGAGPGRAYSVIVRVYFGSRPTAAMRTQAQRALGRLRLPLPR
jgi:hypothetical protein